MISKRLRSKTTAIYGAFLLALPANCHIEMSYPYPLRSKFNPMNSYSDIDYSMTSPLNSDGSNFPCKGYQNDRPIQPVVTYSAGSRYNMTLAGSAMHGGGSCQLSLSYDNGATFQVIQSMIGGCPLTEAYNFTIPSYAPTGTALFAWTWQNLIGNPEYYMNCAEVNIVSGYQRRQRRRGFSSYSQLPDIWKGNLKGLNNCTTNVGEDENETVVYPQPGPAVVYGGGFNSSSTPTPGDCDAPKPYGQTYRDLSQSNSSAASSSRSQTSNGTTSTSIAIPSSSSAATRQTLLSLVSYSTTTITADCQTTLTLTSMPTYYITAAPSPACTGTSASCPCAANFQCQELSPCIWGCEASSTLAGSVSTRSYDKPPSSQSTRFLTETHAVVPIKPSPSSSTSTGSSNQPPYAGSNVARYLPCVPGTFVCIDSTTWDTCDQTSNGGWTYMYPRKVATGMQCLPFLAPYSSSTSQQGQQGLTPRGYYRDDRIVRARPDGDCDQNGAIQCTDDGAGFALCNQGGWVDMGQVAAGTTCEDGKIV